MLCTGCLYLRRKELRKNFFFVNLAKTNRWKLMVSFSVSHKIYFYNKASFESKL